MSVPTRVHLDVGQFHASTPYSQRAGNYVIWEAAAKPGRILSLRGVMAFQHLLLSFAGPENGICQCACT